MLEPQAEGPPRPGQVRSLIVSVGDYANPRDGNLPGADEDLDNVYYWLTEKAKIEGPTTDSNNPDPALRTRSLVGVQVLSDFTAQSDGRWQGKIYYPFQGRTYRAYISRNPDNSLKVQGCWFFICRTVKWPAAEGVR